VVCLAGAEAHWAEWKRITVTGRLRRFVELMTRPGQLRTYCAVLIPGLLQTESYARAACLSAFATPPRKPCRADGPTTGSSGIRSDLNCGESCLVPDDNDPFVR